MKNALILASLLSLAVHSAIVSRRLRQQTWCRRDVTVRIDHGFDSGLHPAGDSVLSVKSVLHIIVRQRTSMYINVQKDMFTIFHLKVAGLRSWQISLLMLVTLPMMAFGAVLMASAVEDALRLSTRLAKMSRFCYVPCCSMKFHDVPLGK